MNVKISSDSLKKRKSDYKKSSTAKLSADTVCEHVELVLNAFNLLISEEKTSYFVLAKKLIKLDENLNQHFHCWRQQVKLLGTIRDNIEYFPASELCAMYSETLLDYAREGIRPLQYASLELLAAILLHNYDLEEADGIIDQIISEFAESECSFTKKLFVDFFEI